MSLENQRVLESLERLAAALKDLPDRTSPENLSHWRINRPEGVETAFKILEQGNQLVSATSTKYTLVTKIDIEEGSKLAKDLLQGCELLGTAALVIHDNAMGCSRSMRKLVKHAVRAVVHTCISLLQVFLVAGGSTKNAAPKTGAIWDACEKITKLPTNNRNAMRRDLFTWMVECQDTLQEFSELLQLPTSTSETETTYEMFTAGQSDDYSPNELPIATASLALIKCSRGSINVAIQACEAVGAVADDAENNNSNKELLLSWIVKLHDFSRTVGDGMTDLGSLLYPPLDVDDLGDEVTSQCNAIVELHKMIILDDPPIDIDFASDLVQLATNISTAAQARAQEAQDGMEQL